MYIEQNISHQTAHFSFQIEKGERAARFGRIRFSLGGIIIWMQPAEALQFFTKGLSIAQKYNNNEEETSDREL